LIKLAEPLYEAQRTVYSLAGKPLPTRYSQDPELLGFLGTYMRKINPNALIEAFTSRLEAEEKKLSDASGSALVICDDMRRPDADYLKASGFVFVRIVAEPSICLARRQSRGDLNIGASLHPIEQGLDELEADFTITNNSTMDHLADDITSLIRSLLDDSNRPDD
jgi:hypothetical protein